MNYLRRHFVFVLHPVKYKFNISCRLIMNSPHILYCEYWRKSLQSFQILPRPIRTNGTCCYQHFRDHNTCPHRYMYAYEGVYTNIDTYSNGRRYIGVVREANKDIVRNKWLSLHLISLNIATIC